MLEQSLNDWRNHLETTYVFSGGHAYKCVSVMSKDGDMYEDDDTAISIDELIITTRHGEDLDGSDITYGFPPVGMFDHANNRTLYYVSYRAARQFCKSLSDRVITISPINVDYLRRYYRVKDIIPSEVRLSSSAIEQAMNNRYVGVEEAVSSLISGEYSGRAIARHFGIVIQPKMKYPVLVHKNKFVGTVPDKVVLNKQFEALKEELEEEIREEVSVSA